MSNDDKKVKDFVDMGFNDISKSNSIYELVSILDKHDEDEKV